MPTWPKWLEENVLRADSPPDGQAKSGRAGCANKVMGTSPVMMQQRRIELAESLRCDAQSIPLTPEF